MLNANTDPIAHPFDPRHRPEHVISCWHKQSTSFPGPNRQGGTRWPLPPPDQSILHPNQSTLHPTKASPSCCSAATKGSHSALSNLPKWGANNGVARTVATRKQPSEPGAGPPLATVHHRGIVHNNAYCGSRSQPRVSFTIWPGGNQTGVGWWIKLQPFNLLPAAREKCTVMLCCWRRRSGFDNRNPFFYIIIQACVCHTCLVLSK